DGHVTGVQTCALPIYAQVRFQRVAVTAYVHAYYGDPDPLESNLGIARAFPVDAALGLVDCLEWSGSSRSELAVWHHALNNDLKEIGRASCREKGYSEG